MALTMDPGEILREYNAAASKDKQVAILAELNCCRPMEIALCLREQGADLTATWRARLAAHDRAEGKTKMKDPAPAPEATVQEPTESAPDTPGWLTAGKLQQMLGRIPGDVKIRLHGATEAATLWAFTESYDACTGETELVLELG
jgi:hypothetical protein